MTTEVTHVGRMLATASMFVALLLCGVRTADSQEKPEQLAKKSAETWVAFVHSGRYAESWDEAAQLFKAAVSKDQWQGMLHATHNPLGQTLSRTLKSATYSTSLPGVPDGEYVVIQFDTSFEHKKSAVETITPMLDKDRAWKVSGYFIK